MFEETEGGNRVRLSQLGWQTGEDRDSGFEYIDRAWGWVLPTLKESLETG